MLLHLDHQYPDLHHEDSMHPLQILILVTPAPVPLAVLMTLAPTLLTAPTIPMILNLHFVFLLVADHMRSLFNPTLWGP